MSLACSPYLQLVPRSEAEALAESATPEILAAARLIERNRIELANERLMTRPNSDAYRRWVDLRNGAMPEAWAIREANEEAERQAKRTGLKVRVDLTEGKRVHMSNFRMVADDLFDEFHFNDREQLAVIEAIKAGRSITLELIGGRIVKVEPYEGSSA